jgi:hypothetical protein
MKMGNLTFSYCFNTTGGLQGADVINGEALKRMLLAFSGVVMEFGKGVESVDLNPVICYASRCVVADARIILAKA